MNITDVTSFARPKRKRVGRGKGSGSGKTCGRGHKGAGARSGYRKAVLAEGGGFPFFRRIPKYGFNNARFRTVYQIVNVEDLASRFDEGAHVSVASLEESGLIRDRNKRVKVLGDGELAKKLTVEAHRFSASATRKIEEAGGAVKWLAPRPKKKFVKRLPERPEAGSRAKPEKKKKAATGGKAPRKTDKKDKQAKKKEQKEQKEQGRADSPDG